MSDLQARWDDLKQSQPPLRIRDAAQQLQVSELQLLALGQGNTCTRLRPEWQTILRFLPRLRSVMALTRSNAMVHEIMGHFTSPHFHGDTALFFREGLDTRYFLQHWHYAYAVNENGRLSLQFFDAMGTAVHKIYLQANSDLAVYHELIANLRTHEILGLLPTFSPKPVATMMLDQHAMQQAWGAIQDVHEGNRLIQQWGGNRQAIYMLLGEDYAQLLPSNSVEILLQQVVQQQLPLMLFGLNHAAVQSYAGYIQRLVTTEPWFNVLDTMFNLHLRTDQIGAVWRIRKPSVNGWIHSLDVFDQQGTEVMVLTDNRQRHQTELPSWTDLIMQLSA